MKTFSLLLVALLAATTLANFVPVSNFNLKQLQGTWNIQSIYDSTPNDWSLAYCFSLTFDVLNNSAVNMTLQAFDGFRNSLNIESGLLYPDPQNPAILYQDVQHSLPPLLVLNTSTLPYWQGGQTNTTIFAFDYASYKVFPGVMVMGGSQSYDTRYDIRPYLSTQSLSLNYTHNFWFVNTACDAHFGWNPLKTFVKSSLLKNWNLLAVYDPAGSGLVPWYTEGALFDWTQAYCANINFQSGKGHDYLMTLSLRSLYQGDFKRSWEVISSPDLNAAIMGFNINENTLLYVQYYDLLGNLILTTGDSVSFLLSTSAKSYTLAEKTLFTANLKTMGVTVDLDYVYPIDNTYCPDETVEKIDI